MDGNQSQKTYPRASTDYAAERSLPIAAVSAETITVDVGIAGANRTWTATNAQYDPTNGEMILTIGQHGLGVGKGIVILDNSLTFTCAQDGNATNHSYPRASDPASGTSRTISAVGETQHTITNAPYDPTTCLLYTSPSPRDKRQSRMPSSA